MENTGKVLFEDQTPQWFIALGKNWIGPLSAADVYAKIVQQEISWAHFVWRKGQKSWQRVCDTQPFQTAVPREPSKSLKEEVVERSREIEKKGPPAPPSKGDDADRKIWYLYFNETQVGPFSALEVEENISAGKLHSRVFAWRDGMGGWEKLETLAGFKGKFPKIAPTIQPATLRSAKAAEKTSTKAPKKEDQRGAPRKPMVAKIYLSNDKELVTAICRDISVGGMQVLTDRIPGDVGGKVKLNVSPVAEKGEKKSDFKPFVAEGTIVRLLEDGRGFSFRFSRLTDSARRSIETYIASSV